MNPAPVKLCFKQANFLITMERNWPEEVCSLPVPAVGSRLSDGGLLVQPRKKTAETSFIIPVCTASSSLSGAPRQTPDQTGEAQL